ncbi:pyrroline-5-carboxylate reductase [Marinospirillum celere]|uniref:Pyrroline-5-carboxylate reductase n=1 Tax=Marinospirillum celere TaxID=1122252 RepID=A0A1I1I522_9GAMM|nr:pyrroline-5-carboxylate reductase [Marinospirillum celere]SFC31539.1 pyrroline-5-carboxylate reductase [Marinospirillum celere]
MQKNSTPRVAFIGAGNMAGAILRGLIQQGFPADHIWAADPGQDKLDALAKETGIQVTTDNAEAVMAVDLVVLAVKPQRMQQVLQPLQTAFQQQRPLVVSIAAGLTCATLQGWLGEALPLVRSMPNTPSLLGAGVAGLYATAEVSDQQKSWVEAISQAVGEAVWVSEESQLEAVTAVSGSGPAYYFLFTEALAAAGEKLGLPAELALKLAEHTALGAGRMLSETPETPAELRARVTSPGGTTAEAIRIFEEQGLHKLVDEAAQAAAKRARELAEELKG